MRIATKIVFDIETGAVLYREGFTYEGPLDSLGGGPSQSQKDAAAAQADASRAETAIAQSNNQRQTDAYNSVLPFASGLMKDGLPQYGAMVDWAGGNSAKAYAPARAALDRQLSSIGSLPSGFKLSQMNGINENQAQAYDANLQGAQGAQQDAKMQGANIINGNQATYNPAQMYGVVNSANSSIMNAPLATPGVAGVLGGVASAALSANKF